MKYKMRENRLRWFGHVRRRHVDATIIRIDCLEVMVTSREKGRPKKSWLATLRNDLKALN